MVKWMVNFIWGSFISADHVLRANSGKEKKFTRMRFRNDVKRVGDTSEAY